jgi:hypothetical protein
VYASIRQAKAKTGMAEDLARRIKEGAIPIISDVEGFLASLWRRAALAGRQSKNADPGAGIISGVRLLRASTGLGGWGNWAA